MPEQVAFEKHFCHIVRAIFRQPTGRQKRLAEALQDCGVELRATGIYAQRHRLQGELQRRIDRLGEMKVQLLRISAGTSAKSFRFWSGRTTVVTPERAAANTFSLMRQRQDFPQA